MIPVEDDLDRIMGVMERAFDPAFGEAWNRRQVSDALLLPHCRYGLITANGTIPQDADPETAGFFLARRVLDEEELLLFAILPEFRRRGLGHALLTRMREEAVAAGMVRIFLEMRAGNPAEILYHRHGFRPVGIRRGYYRAGDGSRIDAISQELRLD